MAVCTFGNWEGGCYEQDHQLSIDIIHQPLHSLKLTQPLKMVISNRIPIGISFSRGLFSGANWCSCSPRNHLVYKAVKDGTLPPGCEEDDAWSCRRKLGQWGYWEYLLSLWCFVKMCLACDGADKFRCCESEAFRIFVILIGSLEVFYQPWDVAWEVRRPWDRVFSVSPCFFLPGIIYTTALSLSCWWAVGRLAFWPELLALGIWESLGHLAVLYSARRGNGPSYKLKAGSIRQSNTQMLLQVLYVNNCKHLSTFAWICSICCDVKSMFRK